MAEPMHFDHRMSDADSLMWHAEKDPLLRSTITVVWRLDRPPDRARLDEKIERATRSIPRLRPLTFMWFPSAAGKPSGLARGLRAATTSPGPTTGTLSARPTVSDVWDCFA
jgi:hypothetical protein